MAKEKNPITKVGVTKEGKYVLITWNGKTQHLAQWARDLGLTVTALHYRLRIKNWSIEEAMATELSKSLPRFHGTREMYKTWKCRCKECVAWQKVAKSSIKQGLEYIPIKAPNPKDEGRWYCAGVGRTKFFKWKNQIKTVNQWAETYEVNPQTLYYRLFVKKVDVKTALTQPRDYHKGVMEHGTKTAYDCYKCRCDECKAANAAYNRKRYWRKKQELRS